MLVCVYIYILSNTKNKKKKKSLEGMVNIILIEDNL